MKYRNWIIIVSFSLFILSCQSEYDKVKQRESSSGKIYTDLFLGLELEMTRKQFFDSCWEMNQQGILVNGAHHLQVLYNAELPSGKTADMNFYPKFENERIYFMPVEFKYHGWFPNNPEVSSKALLGDVVDYLEGWYGKGFFEVTNKDKSVRAMVKIDGNRLVRVFVKDLTSVRVEILDTRVKEIHEINN